MFKLCGWHRSFEWLGEISVGVELEEEFFVFQLVLIHRIGTTITVECCFIVISNIDFLLVVCSLALGDK